MKCVLVILTILIILAAVLGGCMETRTRETSNGTTRDLLQKNAQKVVVTELDLREFDPENIPTTLPHNGELNLRSVSGDFIIQDSASSYPFVEDGDTKSCFICNTRFAFGQLTLAGYTAFFDGDNALLSLYYPVKGPSYRSLKENRDLAIRYLSSIYGDGYTLERLSDTETAYYWYVNAEPEFLIELLYSTNGAIQLWFICY